MDAVPHQLVRITGGFWSAKQAVNARQAIYHQWEQLDRTGCFRNFRLAAGKQAGFREGFFFADSDAYKWLDAACVILANGADDQLQQKVDAFISLIEAAMTPDGYLYTYNQMFFGGERWKNLQIEHELYCLGHLFEAAVSHSRATGSERLLNLAIRSADLLLRDFWEAPARLTDGHPEIELALLRLSEMTGRVAYRELARRLLERRGRTPGFGWLYLRQLLSTARRMQKVTGLRTRYYRGHPEQSSPEKVPGWNSSKKPPFIELRLITSMFSGKFIQQHKPIKEESVPVGHAVRFTYLQAAAARLLRVEPEDKAIQTMRKVWERMVTRRMFVTGGLGALPLIEGFGRDGELDPQTAYAETCAALGSMFWNRELALLTGEPCYDGLYEWQLYNASAVGMGVDGRSYLYHNPLESRGGTRRQLWYDVPCCPSNISRTWAGLSGDIYAWQPGEVRVRQFISSQAEIPFDQPVRLEQDSGLPWEGRGRLVVHCDEAQTFTLSLRIPGWAGKISFILNGKPIEVNLPEPNYSGATACGFDPREDRLVRLERTWRDGDNLEFDFEMPVRLLKQAKEIHGCGGKVAVTRGPVVYCLESIDNLDGVMGRTVQAGSLGAVFDDGLLGGVMTIEGVDEVGGKLKFIPYYAWANRGPGEMTVFVEAMR